MVSRIRDTYIMGTTTVIVTSAVSTRTLLISRPVISGRTPLQSSPGGLFTWRLASGHRKPLCVMLGYPACFTLGLHHNRTAPKNGRSAFLSHIHTFAAIFMGGGKFSLSIQFHVVCQSVRVLPLP